MSLKYMMKEEKKKIKPTQAQKKMSTYLCSLAFNQDFLGGVVDIRKKFSLPEGGFKEDLANEFDFIEKLPVYTSESGNEESFDFEVQVLASRFDIAHPWFHEITRYVLYNDFFFSTTSPFIDVIDMFEIQNERSGDYWEDDERDGDTIVADIVHSITSAFPIGIFISPHATRNDIIDYIEKQYKREIEPLQAKYRDGDTKIGKVRGRSRDIQERNAFICKNQHLPKKELVSIVNKKYSTNLEYSYVSKIIREKCKKRL